VSHPFIHDSRASPLNLKKEINQSSGMASNPPLPIPESVNLVLQQAKAQNQRLVLLTCGISGSGKSSLALSIVEQYPNFVRLSIDKYIFENHGVYGRDYTEDGYEGLQGEAHERLEGELGNLIAGEKGVGGGERDVVVDLSFWRKEERGWWRERVRELGKGKYRVVLVVFRGSEEVLWERIGRREERWKEEGLGEGRPVGRELLGQFVRGFEWPNGEGEIVVDVV
jgi:predicted kinase